MTPAELKAWRNRRRWTQRQAGDVLIYSSDWFNKAERGTTGIPVAVAHMCASVDLLCDASDELRSQIFQTAPSYRKLWDRIERTGIKLAA